MIADAIISGCSSGCGLGVRRHERAVFSLVRCFAESVEEISDVRVFVAFGEAELGEPGSLNTLPIGSSTVSGGKDDGHVERVVVMAERRDIEIFERACAGIDRNLLG